MKAILDAGVFVAVDRRDRRVAAMLRVLQQRRIALRSSAAVIGQVWRNGRKQAEIARFLPAVDVRSLELENGRQIGELLAEAKSKDVIDAHVVTLAEAGDQIFTSDRGDLERLVAARTLDVTLVDV